MTELNQRFDSAFEGDKETTGKLFKSNQEAKDLLTQIKLEEESLKEIVTTRKEEAKNIAVTALEEVKTLVTEAKTLVENAPTGKDSHAEIEAFKADLAAIDEAVSHAQEQIDAENFIGTKEACPGIAEKVTSVSEQIKTAIEKISAQKGKKK